jgi:putative phosphoribosyl transferase
VGALTAEADDVVVLALPRGFRAVGEWYLSFSQLTDDDVLDLLKSATWGDTPAPGGPDGSRP